MSTEVTLPQTNDQPQPATPAGAKTPAKKAKGKRKVRVKAQAGAGKRTRGPSNQTITETAHVRAAVLAFLGNNPLRPVQGKELREIPEVAAVLKTKKHPDQTFNSIMMRLIDTGQVLSRKEGTRNQYALPLTRKRAAPKASATVKPVRALKEKLRTEPAAKTLSVPSPVANLQVDLVKSSGRVRITLAGMVIEIGVTES